MELLISLILLAIEVFVLKCCVEVLVENHRRKKLLTNAEKMLGANARIAGETLSVYHKHERFSDVLATRPHMIDTYNYDPLKVHIGAVTVGGVTSGGVYTTGGKYYAKGVSTGRKELVFRRYEEGKMISYEVKRINLSESLAAEARETPVIKEYMVEDAIEVVRDVEISAYACRMMEAGMREGLCSGGSLQASTQIQRENAEGYPDEEKCRAIIRWLSGR